MWSTSVYRLVRRGSLPSSSEGNHECTGTDGVAARFLDSATLATVGGFGPIRGFSRTFIGERSSGRWFITVVLDQGTASLHHPGVRHEHGSVRRAAAHRDIYGSFGRERPNGYRRAETTRCARLGRPRRHRLRQQPSGGTNRVSVVTVEPVGAAPRRPRRWATRRASTPNVRRREGMFPSGTLFVGLGRIGTSIKMTGLTVHRAHHRARDNRRRHDQ